MPRDIPAPRPHRAPGMRPRLLASRRWRFGKFTICVRQPDVRLQASDVPVQGFGATSVELTGEVMLGGQPSAPPPARRRRGWLDGRRPCGSNGPDLSLRQVSKLGDVFWCDAAMNRVGDGSVSIGSGLLEPCNASRWPGGKPGSGLRAARTERPAATEPEHPLRPNRACTPVKLILHIRFSPEAVTESTGQRTGDVRGQSGACGSRQVVAQASLRARAMRSWFSARRPYLSSMSCGPTSSMTAKWFLVMSSANSVRVGVVR